LFGCGRDGHEGKSTAYEHGASEEPWSRSCPRYYYEMQWFQMVMADLEDYRRGAMGPVQDMEAPHLDLLRVAHAEKIVWEQENHRVVSDQMMQTAERKAKNARGK